jgi:hypothetical protein
MASISYVAFVLIRTSDIDDDDGHGLVFQSP